MPEVGLELYSALVEGECVPEMSDCVIRRSEREAFGEQESNRGHLHWSIYGFSGGIEVPYCVPYSYELNFDNTRKGVAKLDRVLCVGLLVHCKRKGNL